ncbi:hypothetical protein TYRP_015724 [Tyrophagus putrescentiae]|nr:hypothetical protein TYRP_015724 [Tyrophagus putrescentiae]
MVSSGRGNTFDTEHSISVVLGDLKPDEEGEPEEEEDRASSPSLAPPPPPPNCGSNLCTALTIDYHGGLCRILTHDGDDVTGVATVQLNSWSKQTQRPVFLHWIVGVGDSVVDVDFALIALRDVSSAKLGYPLVDWLRVVIEEPLHHQVDVLILVVENLRYLTDNTNLQQL